MINNSYDLVWGIYIAIIAFIAGYLMLGENKQLILKPTTLNIIFMLFFIIIFFLIGYLFRNLMLVFKDVSKKQPNEYINTNELVEYNES